MIEVVVASTPEQIDDLRTLLHEYLGWALAIDTDAEDAPTFSGVEEELATLPGVYAPPGGRLLLARSDGQPAGCVALKPVNATTGELKRMYVRPVFRGQGIGSRLVEALVESARAAGYRRVILDSHHTMTGAHRIYQAAGFEFVDPPEGFPESLVPVVVFMAMDLTRPGG